MLNLIKKIKRNRYLAIDVHYDDLKVLDWALAKLNYGISKIEQSNLGEDRVRVELVGLNLARLNWRKFALVCDELPFKSVYNIQIFG